jgi:hypothetical protein
MLLFLKKFDKKSAKKAKFITLVFEKTASFLPKIAKNRRKL